MNNILAFHVSITKIQQLSVYDQFYLPVSPLITPFPDYFEGNLRYIGNIIYM